ncbi:hypothetical protein Htur_1534 [Haloterrigena turkmenica DSM 5511]|uniref:Uncharacterized protein n=1 Tax=Haloterrigena turkmenica (strain ATCC 51198 / DSM 5511 / JCM 9101 / NCIMB 13204 / VKM B-1734 / 4k) TaxID=543526 RepID=D2RQT9_HALTV|nr:hypothetical protein [Haloterrigena turkmenica]ADB60420.1 hypothetical protein Htur_1534 [Haloterrigena turkmenica DSM 5511]
MSPLPRREVYLYYVSMAVCGGSLGFIGLSGLLSGGLGVVPVLLTIGGLGMVAGSVFEALSGAPKKSVPDRRLLWLTVAGAVLAIVGGVLIVLD